MALSLFTGCGKDGEDNTNNADTSEYVYVPSYETLDLDNIQNIDSCAFTGDEVIFLGSVQDGEESYTDDASGEVYTYPIYKTKLFSLNINTGEITTLAYEQSDEGNENGGSYTQGLFEFAGGIGLLINSYEYQFDLPADFDEENDEMWNYFVNSANFYELKLLNRQGEVTSTINISEYLGEGSYVDSDAFAFDDNGNVYISSDDGVIVINPNSGESITIPLSTSNGSYEWISGLFSLDGNKIAAAIYTYDAAAGTSKQLIREIDLEAKTMSDGFDAPYNAAKYYPGDESYDLYWSSSSSFFGYSAETGESEKFFSWIDCDISYDSIIGNPIIHEDGTITLISGTYNNSMNSYGSVSVSVSSDDSSPSQKVELITLTKTPSDEVPHKETVTLACSSLNSDMRSQIINFNKRSSDFRIEVTDYGDYNTNEDYSAGITKLNTEIIAGNIPDIIMTENLPVSHYSSMGLLEDLLPYIEGDAEIGGMDGLVAPVFDALTNDDGELFQIASSFYIISAVGNPTVVGDRSGWNLDEFYEAYSKMPEGADIFNQYTTQTDILQFVNALCLDQFIDWETGICYFDTDGFKDMLRFVSLFPSDFDWDNFDWSIDSEDEYTRISSGKQMLSAMALYDTSSYQYYKAIFGGEMSFVGFPTAEKDGTAFALSDGIAMSSACKNKDMAWQFMRTILTSEFQQYKYAFPTSKEGFDLMLENAMTPQYYTDSETGEQHETSTGGMSVNGFEVSIYSLTQDEADQIMNVINSTTRIFAYDESLNEIITDATAAYFAGTKGLDETASIVQSRVKLYINEQK